MAINLGSVISVNLDDAVSVQELQMVIGVPDRNAPNEETVEEVIATEEASKTEKKRIDIKSVVYAAKSDNKQAKRRKKKAKSVQVKQDTEPQERALQNAKVRKYTKEMQNRDAIVNESRKMHNKASRTRSSLDDKFAMAARTPSRRFDNIIYNSATADDASELINDIFEAVMDDSE